MAEEKRRSKGFIVFLKAFLIALFVGFTILVYGYFVFEYNRLKGINIQPFEGWRSYVSFLISKIPYVNRFVKYEPLKIMTPGLYFEESATAAVERVRQILAEIQAESQQLAQDFQTLETSRKAVLELRKAWEEKNLEMDMLLRRLRTPEDVKKVADTLKQADPANAAVILASERFSVVSIAAAMQSIDATTRSDILSELGKIDADKAAEVMNELGSIEKILADLDRLNKDLEKKRQELNKYEASLMEAELLKKVAIEALQAMNEQQILKMIDSLSLDEVSVMTLFSHLPIEKVRELLKQIRDQKPELFERIVARGVGL